MLALSAAPATIEEADDGATPGVEENVSELTVTLTNAKTFAGEQTLTLTFAGTAEAGTHYTVAPVDADPDAGGHQVTLAAGASSVAVTVSAVDNATADGARTIEVSGAHDGTQFGSPVTVTIDDDDVPNTAPTAADGEVTTNEDTAYAFDAGDFNFADADTGDVLASVTVVTLPAAGVLALDGAPVTADQSVAKADLDADSLVYTPPAHANGDDFASFTFRVSDGTDESASTYTMTVDVTAVNDPATGKPVIGGTARVGETLSVDLSGITDVDGKTQADNGDAGYAYAYQWLHVDGVTQTPIAGATVATYPLTAADASKSVAVRVTFTDDHDHEEVVTSDAEVVALTVTIEANHETIGGGLEDLVFTLERSGATTGALEVTVALTQDEAWLVAADLSHEVTFQAGDDTARLKIAADDFSFDPTASGELAATVSVDGMESGSVTVEVISVDGPLVTVRLGERAYTFSEPQGDASVDIVLEVAPGLPRVGRELYLSLEAIYGTAVSPDDYLALSVYAEFGGADFDETSGAGGCGRQRRCRSSSWTTTSTRARSGSSFACPRRRAPPTRCSTSWPSTARCARRTA